MLCANKKCHNNVLAFEDSILCSCCFTIAQVGVDMQILNTYRLLCSQNMHELAEKYLLIEAERLGIL